MYGDSLMLQSFIALVCRLHGSKGVTSTFQVQWYYESWLGPQNCPYRSSEHCYLKSGSCATFNGSLRICFVWHSGVDIQSSAGLVASARTLNMTRNDVILASIGTWFFKDNIDEASRNFSNAVRSLVGEVTAHGLEQNFMWLEVSPQHFGNERVAALGYFNEELKQQYSARINGHGAPARTRASGQTEVRTQCVALPSKTMAWRADPRNRLSEALLPVGTPVVRIWDLLADLPHAHISTRNAGEPRWVVDCTHWCLPGPLVEIFPRALVDAFRPFTSEPPVPL
jgi:hypothetical protein